MIKIRLAKGGVKGNPFYRIVAIDERKKAKGRALEILGVWHPNKNIKKISLARVEHWTSKGAKVSNAVLKLMAK